MKELLDLHALADGELTKDEAKKLRTQISENPSAEAELSAILNLVDCLRQKSIQHSSEECWAVCVGRLNELDRSKKVEGFVGRYAWAMCAALFVLVIGGRYAVKDVRGGDTSRVADILNIRSSSATTPQQTQQQQFYSDLLRLSKQSRSGVRIVRDSVGTVFGQPVRKLDLVDHNGPITFFAIQGVFSFEDASKLSPGSDLSSGVVSSRDQNGGFPVNCVVWVDRGYTLVLAGPRSVSALTGAVVQLGLKSPN